MTLLPRSRVPFTADVVAGLVAGVVGTWVKSQAEGRLQPLAEKVLPPAPDQKAERGADPADHPENMPPAAVADDVVSGVTGRHLSTEERAKSSEYLHWVMGVGSALAFTLVGRRLPVVRRGVGLPFGLALFAGTHGSLLPAAGWQAPVGELPRAWWLWEGGSHLVYGATVETVLNVLEKPFTFRRKASRS